MTITRHDPRPEPGPACPSRPISPACLLPLLGAALLAMAAGCTGRNHPNLAAGRSGNAVFDLFSAYVDGTPQKWTFDAVDIVDIDVESFNGDVIVVALEEGTTATVTITPQAVHGYGRGEDAKATVDAISATAEKAVGPLGPVLRVRTATDAPEVHYLRSHITIEAPAVENVRIRTSRGNVLLKSVRGAIDVASSYGNVRVLTPYPITSPVTIVNKDGDIDFRVPGDSSGVFDLETVSGEIKLRCREGRWIAAQPGNARDRMRATLNDGSERVLMRTVDGNIRVAVIPNPMEVGLFIIDP